MKNKTVRMKKYNWFFGKLDELIQSNKQQIVDGKNKNLDLMNYFDENSPLIFDKDKEQLSVFDIEKYEIHKLNE